MGIRGTCNIDETRTHIKAAVDKRTMHDLRRVNRIFTLAKHLKVRVFKHGKMIEHKACTHRRKQAQFKHT
jgi:hypothetical protein